MDRRSFLKTTGAVAGATALPIASAAASETLSAPALAAGRHRLRLGTRFPVDQPGTSTFLTRLAESVSAMSEGRIELKVPMAADGGAELVLGFPEGPGDLAIAHEVVAGIPGGLDEPHTVSWLSFGGGLRLWSDLAYALGQKVFYAGHTGEGPSLWANAAELRTPKDRFVAIGGFGVRVATALGGTASPDKRAEFLEGFSPLADLMSDLPRRFANCGGSPFHDKGRTLALTMPLSHWEAISASDKAIFEAAVASHAPLIGSEFRAHRAMAHHAMQQRFPSVGLRHPRRSAKGYRSRHRRPARGRRRSQ